MSFDLGEPAPRAELVPRRLELSVDPTNGSLLVAPLSQVLLASTDALYSDLYNMAHGELEVVTGGGGAADEDFDQDQAIMKKSDRMSNLSFAQRRHELAWRLFQHARGLSHVAALTAANASTSLSQIVKLCRQTLLNAHLHWRQADEAQDALYFHHGQLFAARAAPHDVYGALDVLIGGTWYDLPSNLRLASAAQVPELSWSPARLQQEWELAVRTKLVQGEIGYQRRQKLQGKGDAATLWKLVVRGGIVRLVYGIPKDLQSTANYNADNEPEYPITALLTVFASSSGHMDADTTEPSTWTLLALDVRVQAKTGEFSHQLESSNRQRYDLHRLAARAMLKEEVDYKKLRAAHEESTVGAEPANGKDELAPAKPLQALFDVAHTFALSWQLELLSAQAQALRRGVWGAVAASTSAIHVDPVRFLGNHMDGLLGTVAVSFWKIDDSYGCPTMGELTVDDLGASGGDSSIGPRPLKSTKTSQLTLAISAQVNVGVRVSLSGGQSMMEQIKEDPALQVIVKDIIESTSNPLELSVSDALLAATKLCAIQRCTAVVNALQPSQAQAILPNWMHLTAHGGIIAVSARVEYHGVATEANGAAASRNMPILFRLECDTRTGSFVPTFSRQTKLLGELACNNETASENMSVRIAALPPNRRRAAAATSSGRAVRTMFDGLVRSMNILGERVGVGGTWEDLDEKSSILRERAVLSAASDAKLSLIKCCGAAALYGLAPVAIGAGLGLGAVEDIAGEPLASSEGMSFLQTPPLSILLDQELIEEQTKVDAVTKKSVHMQQTLYCFLASATDDCLKLVPLDISMKVLSPSTLPTRLSYSLSNFRVVQEDDLENGAAPPPKRIKLTNGEGHAPSAEDLMLEVTRFASILSATLDHEEVE